MIKVKEYLDNNFYWEEKSTATLKGHGHYDVQGHWGYPKDKPITSKGHFTYDANYIRCDCNNETIQINVIINGHSAGYYGYLQTYEHLPREGPDINGYYVRSTDEEVIRYIDTFYNMINKRRREKILKLKSKIYETT